MIMTIVQCRNNPSIAGLMVIKLGYILLLTSSCRSVVKTMIKKVPQNKLGISEPDPSWFGNPSNQNLASWTNKNWLKSRFHFSFAEYSNPSNQNFGVLRVLNDDLVQPDRGFGSHPHRDVEICTYVVHGQLTHQDNMGTKETLPRGAIQFMTAGTGVVHSEHNLDKTNPLRFIQIWISTRQKNLRPNYGSAISSPESRLNQWYHMVSDTVTDNDVPIKINQDANIYVTEVDPNTTVTFNLQEGRQAYLLCIEGASSVSVNDNDPIILDRHEAAEVYGGGSIRATPVEPTIKTSETVPGTIGSHLLLVEMALTGKGRSDI